MSRTIETLSIIVLFVAPLTGCALFEDLKQEDNLDKEVKDACAAYCGFAVDGAEDCLRDWYDCSMDDWDANFDSCNDDCLGLRDGLDDDRLWEAVDCMWCVVDQVGDSTTCVEFVGVGEGAICDDDCEEVDDLSADFDWINEFWDNSEQFCE